MKNLTNLELKKRGANNMFLRALIIVMLLMLTCPPAMQAAQKPNDREAFAGLKTAKVIFDVRVTDLEKLVFNLRLFDEKGAWWGRTKLTT